MEQTAALPPPLTAGISTATTTAHPSSVDSSPRSRTIDSWVEDSSPYPNNGSTVATATATGGVGKLRLMCSSGGHIIPRPHDKSLCYVGGDTRIVVVDRHTTLSDLTNRLTKTLLRSSTSSTTTSFTIKYQLPSEDLDSLISVTTDEDLENMIDEYDRLNLNLNLNSSTTTSFTSKSSRIRLFLFPNHPESVSSIGSVLETATKSEDWFLNALNGTTSSGFTFSDTSSVNCLLGLEDDVAVPEKKDVSNKYVVGKVLRTNNPVQDVQSVPDSPMLETTSSFGSASSTPSLANVQTVTVHVDDQQKVAGGVEEQLSVQQHVKDHEDVSFVAEPVPVVVAGVDIGSTVAVSENPNSNSNCNRLLSEDERSEQSFQIAHHKQQQQQQQQHQPKPSADSVSSDGTLTNSLSSQKPPVIYPAAHSQFPTNNIIDQNTRIQIQPPKIQDSAYSPSTPTTPVDPQNIQPHHQPQFIHTAVPAPQYLPHHHHHPSGVVPMAPFYQIYPSQTQYHSPLPALDQHNMVYYMPARQPPRGNQVPPPSGLVTAPLAVQAGTKTEPPPGVYRATTNPGASAPQLVQIPPSQQQIQPQFVSYSHIHQGSQPVASGGNYAYGFADPSQQGPRMYYAAQPLPPQTIASTLPVEAQAGYSINQQVRTSQP